jgi:hypothetical protein
MSGSSVGWEEMMRSTLTPATLALALLAPVPWGCSDNTAECTVAADCPAGQTCSDGHCLPEYKPDGSKPATDGGTEAAIADQGEDKYVFPDLGPGDGPLCPANNNGKVEREELVITVPTSVTYELGTEITVDLAGASSGGQTVWDLTAAASDDHPQPLALDTLPAWAAGSFTPPPGNITYTMLMDTELDAYGVFTVSDTQMLLLGMISGEQDKGELSYSTPIEMLHFPVQAGDSYTSDSLATGHWVLSFCPTCWLCTECPLNNWDSYEVTVAGTGKLKLPGVTLDVVLVRTTVTQNWWSTTTVFMFMAECYGTVARVIVDGDPGTNLSQVVAKERWRLASP